MDVLNEKSDFLLLVFLMLCSVPPKFTGIPAVMVIYFGRHTGGWEKQRSKEKKRFFKKNKPQQLESFSLSDAAGLLLRLARTCGRDAWRAGLCSLAGASWAKSSLGLCQELETLAPAVTG